MIGGSCSLRLPGEYPMHAIQGLSVSWLLPCKFLDERPAQASLTPAPGPPSFSCLHRNGRAGLLRGKSEIRDHPKRSKSISSSRQLRAFFGGAGQNPPLLWLGHLATSTLTYAEARKDKVYTMHMYCYTHTHINMYTDTYMYI